MTARSGMAATLEGTNATWFLVGGGLLVVFAANTALGTFVGTSFPPVQGLVGPAGFLLGVVGLFGLYPALADRTPWLARVAAAAAAISALGWLVIVTRNVAEHIVGITTLPEALGIAGLIAAVSMIPTFALFGVASLRAGVHARAVGVLLLVPATAFLLLLANAAPDVLVDAGHVVGYLGVGIALRGSGGPSDSAEPLADATP